MSAPAADPVLRASGLGKVYPPLTPKGVEVRLFEALSLSVAPGEMVAIVGESGAGKTSLLHLLAALDRATTGTIMCGPTDVSRLDPNPAAAYRNRDIGYVWQAHYLLPEFTAAENVAMPLLARGMGRRAALAAGGEWLARVGLGDRLKHRAGELSGGEQQRVSVARALVTKPRLLLADEPTGNLDAATAENVFSLLQTLHREQGLASVLVTHNLGFAHRCDRVFRLHGGGLETC